MGIEVSQFHETFFEESFEGLAAIETGLLRLDAGTVDEDTIDTIFRAAHSIKGGGATFGFAEVASFTHGLESLLDEIRTGRRAPAPGVVDILLQSVDCLREMLSAVRAARAHDPARAAHLRQEIAALLHQRAPAAAERSGGAAPDAGAGHGERRRWRIRFRPQPLLLRTGNDPALMFRALQSLGDLTIAADTSAVPSLRRLNPEACYLNWDLELTTSAGAVEIREVFEWVEGECELHIEALPEACSPASPPRAAAPHVAAGAALAEHSSIRVGIDKVDALINMVGELVITQSMMGQLDVAPEDFDIGHLEKLRTGLALLARNTRELQESVMRIRMLPIRCAFDRFPRMVRDLGHKLGKQVELRTSGEQTELDKTVMEKIGDPLVHLVRNAVDHGIETPAARAACGKPGTGVIRLDAYHKGGNIVIEIGDDGAGFDRARILSKARELGLVDAATPLDDDKVLDLIFRPGFSTVDAVSDVSGRGVGLDVVRRNIRELGGSIDVSSRPGAGTKFTIRLPLTLAILDGQLVKVGTETYIIPLISIVESLQIDRGNVNLIAGASATYRLRDEYLPILRVREIFGGAADATPLAQGLLVVVEGDGHRIGLFVDELLGQQQVVIKSLETNFRRVDGVSGATILGNGSVALIIDVEGLIARRWSRAAHCAPHRAVA